MAEQSLEQLYSGQILALAADIPHTGRLDAPQASVKKRSPLCGSTVTVDLVLDGGRIADFAQNVRACALGQASAAILGAAVIGQHRETIAAGRDALYAMLTEDGPTPPAPFEALEVLEDAGIETEHALEVAIWTNEEGSRYQPGCMGSIAFARGAVPAAWLDVTDSSGLRLGDELAATLAALDAPMRPLGGPVRGYLELHIEQGPALEAEGLAIGAVEAVQGTIWLEATVSGRTAHAGTTGLEWRRDPMAAAAAAIHHLNREIMPGDPMARFTVGRLSAAPGAVNAIPAEVTLTMDIRHPDSANLLALEARAVAAIESAAAERGCVAAVRRLVHMEPARFDDGLVGAIEWAAERHRLGRRRMVSGAFHDALHLARVAPAAMIFVPSKDGLSHNEAEYTAPADCAAGAQVLLTAALTVAKPPEP